MEITITMTTGNDAFQDDADVAAALVELANRIRTKGLGSVSKVTDANGLTVGTVTVEDDDDDNDFDDADPGDMDGDHESGLASAGWGTDEDYGGGSEPFDDLFLS